MSATKIAFLQGHLLSEIPLTQHMGLQVAAYDEQQLTLSANFNKNINHNQTAFGGSLSSLCTLSAWGLLVLKLREHSIAANVVVQQSSIDYLKPITKDFTAVATMPADAAFDRFLKTLQRRQIARVKLSATIHQDGDLAVCFDGQFVATKDRSI